MPVLPKVKSRIAVLAVLAAALASPSGASAQEAPAGESVAARVLASPAEPNVILEDLTGAAATNTVIEIILAEQRLTVRVGEKLAVQSPVTTGRKTAPTPEGEFTIKGRTEQVTDEDYGNVTDKGGHILIAGVFSKLDSPPRNSRFSPVPRKFALEVEGGKTRILAGHVRTTPSTDGTIIIPEAVAWALYEKIPDGTKVRILKESPATDAGANPAPSAPPAP